MWCGMNRMCVSTTLAVTIAIVPIATDARNEAVATRMHNIVFHLDKDVELRVDDLSGHLVSNVANKPAHYPSTMCSRTCWTIDSARVAMTPESLTNDLNNFVFAANDAPFRKLKVSIDGQELVQSGLLKKGVDVPFSMRAAISATPDGHIRIHPISIKVAGFLSKGVLDAFGLKLERLVKLKNQPSVTLDGDDLLLDPQGLLPPPAIRGRLTKVWLENGLIVEQFGAVDAKPTLTPPDINAKNYMYYRGGTLRFGKLTMEDTDLLLEDADQKDPFDFSPAKYNEQLVAGYSKNTVAHGLIV